MSNISYLDITSSRSPDAKNGKVTRQPYKCLRPREYFTPDEVQLVMKAAKSSGRHGHRDETLIPIGYRHALRVSELVNLRWDMIDLKGFIHVSRMKNGIDSVHPLRGPELRALRKLRRDYPDTAYVFVSERGGPMTASNVRKMIKRAGEEAGIGFPVHPHRILGVRTKCQDQLAATDIRYSTCRKMGSG